MTLDAFQCKRLDRKCPLPDGSCFHEWRCLQYSSENDRRAWAAGAPNGHVEDLIAENVKLRETLRDLAPHCRYVDRKEAEAFKARIAAVLGPEVSNRAPCPTCGGTGNAPDDSECVTCDGNGHVAAGAVLGPEDPR